MSDPHSTSPGAHAAGHAPVRSEEDHVSTRTILAVGLGSLLLFLLAGAAAVAYLRVRQAEHGPVARPAEAGKSKIGMVEQDLLDLAVRGVRENARKRERLGSYGWVDRNAGVVHLPIDRAMDLVAQGVRPASGAPSTTAPGAQP
jgi:hypothetical protein